MPKKIKLISYEYYKRLAAVNRATLTGELVHMNKQYLLQYVNVKLVNSDKVELMVTPVGNIDSSMVEELIKDVT